MIELLSLLFWTWVIKTAVTDTIHAVKGTENPRYTLKKAKLKAAGQSSGRYSVGDYLRDLWADALVAETSRRRAKTAAKDTGPVVDEQPAPVSRPTPPPEPTTVAEPRPAPPPHRPVILTPDGPRSWPPRRPRPDEERGKPDPPPVAKPEPAPAPDVPARGVAKVIPINININKKEDPVSVDVDNTEIIGLDQSISYAVQLAERLALHGQSGGEGYIGMLTSQGVTGEALSSAHEAQEAIDLAVAAIRRHAELLRRQLTVQEQYDANPDAGNKEFLTAGR